MSYRPIDPFLVHYFNKIQLISEKYEADLVASGRFEYLETKGNKKIYIEKDTGHKISVFFPILEKKPR